MLPIIVFFLVFFTSEIFFQEKFFVTGSVKIGYDNKIQKQLQFFNSGYQIKASKDGVYFFEIDKKNANYPFYIFIGKNIRAVSRDVKNKLNLNSNDKKMIIKVDQNLSKNQTVKVIKSSQLDVEKDYKKIIFLEMNPDLVKQDFYPVNNKQKNIFILPTIEVIPTKPRHDMSRKRDKNILRSLDKNLVHQKQQINQRLNKKTRSKSKIIS